MSGGWAAVLACAAMTAYVCRGVPWGLALSPAGPPSWAADPAVLAAQAGRLLWALWLCAGWTALGRAAGARLGLRWADRWEEAGVSFALGAGLWGSLLHLAGLAWLWRPAPLAAAAAALAWPLALWARDLRARPPRPRLPRSGWARAAVLACAAALAYHLPLLFLPETFYDALNYHLGMPNLYLLRGGIGATPENSYSGVPSIPMMLYGQALALDPWGVSARLVHFAFLPAILILLRGTAGRLGFAETAPLAAAVFALAPVVQSESFRTSTGLEWALFQAASFHALTAGARAAPGTPERRAWLLVCGLALGFALSTKYLAAGAALGLAAAAAWLARRRPEGLHPPSGREAALAAGAAALVLAPWLARNAAFYGNPLYPFFHEAFAPRSAWLPDWDRVAGQGLSPGLLLSSGHLGRWLLHPLLWSRWEAEFGAAFGPAFLGLAPVLLAARLPAAARLWLILCAASWLPLSFIAHDVTRYMLPGLASWAALAAWSAGLLAEPDRRRAAWTGLAAALAGGAAFLVMRLPAFIHLDAALGGLPFRAYLERERPGAPHYTPPHPAFHWLEDRAGPGERALLVGDARHFPWRLDHLASSEDQRSWLEVLADQAGDGPDLARRLAQQRVRWVVMNRAEMARQRAALRLTPRGAAALKALPMRPAFEVNDGERWVAVYEVGPPPSAPPAGSR